VAYRLYVGSAVAAETFVAAWLAPDGPPSAPSTGEQTAAGFATLVVLEATSADWVALAVARHEAGYRVAVINPRQAHHFFKARLRRAKTDALDARDLARLAAALRPAPWSPPPAVYHEVRQRLVVDGVRQHLDAVIAGGPLGASTAASPRWKPRARGRSRWPA